jgi:predicted DNA-binding transcriptional regulator AlpA
MTARKIALPFPPRGLRRDVAAAYVGVSLSKFDDWVSRGLMPRPKRQDGVIVWDRLALDAAFEDLPSDDPVLQWTVRAS